METTEWKRFLLPYEQTVDELRTKFESLLRSYKKFGEVSPIERLDVRVKNVSSILDKAAKKKIAIRDIEKKIEDIAGVRIICRFVEDIYTIVQIIKDMQGTDFSITEERDYVKNQKASGYRSYHILISYNVYTIYGHYNVPAEIQIRTMAMNSWAVNEHSLNYKYRGNMPEKIQKKLRASADAAFTLDTEMSAIRDEIHEAEQSIQTQVNLVDEILSRIQNLHYIANLDRISELNKHFFELYKVGDLDALAKFNDQLKVMVEIYKVQLV